MAIKQYHTAVYVEIDTDTQEVLDIATDAEVLIGGGSEGSVWNVDTEDWERADWEDDPAAGIADRAVVETVRAGWAAVSQEPRHYVLVVIGDVEPVVNGPFDSRGDRDEFAARYRRKNGPDDGIFALTVPGGGRPTTSAYSGAFFEEGAG